MRRLFVFLTATRRVKGKVRLNSNVRPDLVGTWNGVRIAREDSSKQEVHLWTDASGFGYGAWIPQWGKWTQLQWYPSRSQEGTGLEGQSITTKELLPIVLSGERTRQDRL